MSPDDRSARLLGTSRLAGSTLTMDQAITNVIRFAGVDLAAAVQMAGRNGNKLFPELGGGLAPGSPANIVLFEYGEKVIIRETWIQRRKNLERCRQRCDTPGVQRFMLTRIIKNDRVASEVGFMVQGRLSSGGFNRAKTQRGCYMRDKRLWFCAVVLLGGVLMVSPVLACTTGECIDDAQEEFKMCVTKCQEDFRSDEGYLPPHRSRLCRGVQGRISKSVLMSIWPQLAECKAGCNRTLRQEGNCLPREQSRRTPEMGQMRRPGPGRRVCCRDTCRETYPARIDHVPDTVPRLHQVLLRPVLLQA